MQVYDIILKKRNGGELSSAEIDFLVEGVSKGSIPDYQISAFLMAVFFRGMTKRETAELTISMAKSGNMVDLSSIEGIKADKHSTGGVGDKVTLIVAPIVAACGVKMAKLSGRGLGHSGGTVDKLESIPGFRTEMGMDEFSSIVNDIGIAVIGQSAELAPADKKLYALRDVTATVDSIPLIASSIMSKKLAAGADVILLDVKTGSGAFMKKPEDAAELAREMVDIGNHAGRRCAALITDMDVPLGCAVGNSLEVIESIDCLSGGGPEDLRHECLVVAEEILRLAGVQGDCATIAKEALDSGAAKRKFIEMVKAQSGDVSYVEDTSKFKKSPIEHTLFAVQDGYITHMDTEACGKTSVLLGAGRSFAEQPIDHSAGILIKKKRGDSVKKGEVIAILCTSTLELAKVAEKEYIQAITISDTPPPHGKLIYARVDKGSTLFY